MNIVKRLRAFTLIELLIVITIIGILAVALVPRITGGPAKARDAARKADLQQIATALEFYADDNGGDYPSSSSCVDAIDTDSDSVADLLDYLTTLPEDSNASTGYTTNSYCTDGDYAYIALESGDGYLLMASLENENDSGDGVYEGDSGGTDFSVATGSDAATNLSSNSGVLCSDAAVTCSKAVYVIGR